MTFGFVSTTCAQRNCVKMLFELASIAHVSVKILIERKLNDQCREQIVGDLTRPWPMPGELLWAVSVFYLFHLIARNNNKFIKIRVTVRLLIGSLRSVKDLRGGGSPK